jgi:hypothetical protein
MVPQYEAGWKQKTAWHKQQDPSAGLGGRAKNEVDSQLRVVGMGEWRTSRRLRTGPAAQPLGRFRGQPGVNPFRDIFKDAFVQSEADSILDRIDGSVQKEASEIIQFHPD